MKNEKLLGSIRELLAAASAALVIYGIGSDAIWQEVTGAIVGILTLVWGWKSNQGFEAVSSVIRKVVSSIAGVLVLLGYLTPEKANALFGVVFLLITTIWSMAGKKADDGVPPPGFYAFFLLAACSFLIPSCTNPADITLATPWGSASSDSKGGLTADTKWFSASRDAAGNTIIVPKAPIIIPAK